MPTPTSTAYWRAISIVRMNVTAMTVAWTDPVFQTATMSAGLTVRYPTVISKPASAGMAM